jgi:organic hydroperoxide reductase OsmC/OhrA
LSEYTVTVKWQRDGQDFLDDDYSRGHTWEFDGGLQVAASASPQVVPLPKSVAENVDPEEAFVASLSSCHMLFFLSIAARSGYIIDKYEDCAVGRLARNERGRLAMTKVILRPTVEFSGDRQPTPEKIQKLHERSHEQCFIANSVKAEVVIEPVSAQMAASSLDHTLESDQASPDAESADGVTDWRELREFNAVDLTKSFLLVWNTESESLLIDLDLFLCPGHAFYEEPRPAEKACYRPALLEFPYCSGIKSSVDETGKKSTTETVAALGHGAITGLRRVGEGCYELTGEFGQVEVRSERPILRLKRRAD